MPKYMDRRHFLRSTALATAASGLSLSFQNAQPQPEENAPQLALPVGGLPYDGPNVVLIRFGGGVRRLETILESHRTYCPFIYHELYKRQGVLFPNVVIEDDPGVVTSHGQGTLYILTGRYDRYRDVYNRPFSDRFVAAEPTLFEYFRSKYAVPPHQTLIVNGENRINEEFYTFSNHAQFGFGFRSTVLSLYRFKSFLLRERLRFGKLNEREFEQAQRLLARMENLDYRVQDHRLRNDPKVDSFWRDWRAYFGDSGYVNERGDRLLTTLSQWALRKLRPKLLMINYQDPDYVHWGNRHFYTRAIAIIDDGVRQLWEETQRLPYYRDNTIFVIVPDCGRDNNPCMAVPFQHHFNTRSAREVFIVAAGSGIRHDTTPIERARPHQQSSVAATLGRLMDFPTPHANTDVLEEMIA